MKTEIDCLNYVSWLLEMLILDQNWGVRHLNVDARNKMPWATTVAFVSPHLLHRNSP